MSWQGLLDKAGSVLACWANSERFAVTTAANKAVFYLDNSCVKN